MPTEHGSWAWLLVPFSVGAGVARVLNPPLFLTLVAGLSVFLLRQPATVWLRARRGRARRQDGQAAVIWIAGLLTLAGLCLIGLLWLGRAAMLWLAGPLVVVFALYLLASSSGRTALRSQWMELTGAVALSLMAPAALIAASGRISDETWMLWGAMALQNLLGALYVRLRVHDTHGRPIGRGAIWGAHLAGLAVVAGMGAWGTLPSPAIVPFLFFAARITWAAKRPRPIANIKRFGFTEMGIEFASGAVIVAGYWLP
ncbi:MAG: YwiC-like family protein [Anaerolineae bacterium]